ncbi:unnamed protein product, partial [Prorocentrum cordatum]
GVSEEKACILQQQMAVAFQSDCFSELLKEKGHPIDTAKQWPSNPEDAGDLLIRDEIMSNLGPRDQSEFLFWESMKANDFEVPTAATKGNPIGKRWDRAIRGSNQISKALREGYGQKKTDTEKAAFRREWARKECAKKSTSWSKAMKYMTRCMSLGPPWIQWCSWTESLRGLYVTSGLKETFSQEW